MEGWVKHAEKSWVWGGLYAVVALLGVIVIAGGVREDKMHLVFGGSMFVLMALVGVIHARALRPGRDDSTASNAEQVAWSQLAMGLGAIMVLGGMALGSFGEGKFADHLLFYGYAGIVAVLPAFRRRWIENNRRYREVPEDERDRSIRAKGEYLTKRMLELSFVAFAISWALASRHIDTAGNPLHLGAFLLVPVLLANVAGEARVAWLHWKDRQ